MDALAVQEPPKTMPAMSADIVPPPAAGTAKEPTPAPQPDTAGQPGSLPEQHQTHVSHPTPASSSSSSSVTTAIIATVIIVFGLAGIALYAFMH